MKITLVERTALFAVMASLLFSLAAVAWGSGVDPCDVDGGTGECEQSEDDRYYDRDPQPDEDGWTPPPPPQPKPPNPCSIGDGCGRG